MEAFAPVLLRRAKARARRIVAAREAAAETAADEARLRLPLATSPSSGVAGLDWTVNASSSPRGESAMGAGTRAGILEDENSNSNSDAGANDDPDDVVDRSEGRAWLSRAIAAVAVSAAAAAAAAAAALDDATVAAFAPRADPADPDPTDPARGFLPRLHLAAFYLWVRRGGRL